MLRRLFRGACLALSALVLGIWTIVVFTADDPGVWQRDWAFLREAGQALIQGRLGSVYTTDWSGLGSGHYWLYPPFALWGAAMLAVLPPAPTYAGVLLTQGALAAFVLRHACALGPHAGVERRIDFAFGVLASAPALVQAVMGQLSWLWAAAFVAGALSWRSPLRAGLCFGLLAAKPNWFLPLLGLVALGGLTEAHLRRVGLSMLATAAGLVALSLPLGLGLWADFAASARGYGLLVAEAYPAFKLLTVHAALRSFGWPAGPGALLLGGLALAAAATVWWRDRRSPEPGDRVAAAVLLTICANAYTNFYDGLLLLVPAAAWWFDRSDGPRSRVIGACLAGSWLWLHGAVFVWRESTTLAPVGLLVLIWLLALAWLPEERKPMG